MKHSSEIYNSMSKELLLGKIVAESPQLPQTMIEPSRATAANMQSSSCRL